MIEPTMPLDCVYEFGPFRFLPSKQMLIRDGNREIRLQPRASEVLQVLLENSDRILTRNEILAKVWGAAISVGDGSLDYQVHILRKVLGDEASSPKYIETKKRYGIQFIASVKLISEDITVPAATDKERQAVLLPLPAKPSIFRLRLSRKGLALSSLVVAALATTAVLYFRSSSAVHPIVIVNSDGSWTAKVPVLEEGVKLETNGHGFEVSMGDEIEVITAGSVDIGRGLVRADGEPNYGDPSMDSEFKNHVGGLEMWIGPDKSANRYFIGLGFRGKVGDSGIPTFRVIESRHGYHDGNNTGFFQVTIRKLE